MEKGLRQGITGLRLAAHEVRPFRETLLQDAAEGFLLHQRALGRSPQTLRFYEGRLRRFAWFLEGASLPTEVTAITPPHLRLFMDYLQSATVRWGGTTPSARRRLRSGGAHAYFRALRAFFTWLEAEELIPESPCRKLKAPKLAQTLIEPLSDEALRRLIDTARHDSRNGRRDLAAMLVLLDTGLRAAELVGLTVDDWSSPGGKDWQGERLKVMGKGRKERWVAVSPPTQKALWDYMQRERPRSPYREIFLAEEGTPLTTWGLYRLLRRRARQAGVSGVHPHKFRHTFALAWAKAGGPLHALQSLLGHATPYMSLRYGRMASEEAALLHRQYSPVERLGLRFRR